MRKPSRLKRTPNLLSLLCGLLFFSHLVHAQQPRSLANRSTTRAVVVGISDYQNEGIPDLSYAHLDAQAFVDFLLSKAGGNVPEGNVTMLINDNATQGKIAAAMDWLLAESQPGDKAIIYFAGHGDMETKTMMQHGFLLAYDAPPTTYMAGGAFPVFYLQSIISTLSTQKNVEVMMFSDACRAGKLAGSNIGGPHATAQVLGAQFANEVKVLSCQPNEFSLEGTQWGGGRGVFSYYLIQGLAGLADGNGDGTVTLLEVGRYLEDKVPPETAPYSQIPLTVGNRGQRLFRVDQSRLNELERQEGGEPLVMAGIESRGLEELAFAQTDSSLLPLYLRFEAAVEDGNLLSDTDDNAYSLYQRLSTEESLEPLHGLMRRRLAAALQDDAQQAINAYLQTPAAELARRWNYNEQYGDYPAYLEKAVELLGSAHIMHDHLKARQLYFEGLNLRLEAEKKKDENLFAEALERQEMVLDLMETAAYSCNEIGLIYFHRPQPDLDKAREYFEKANRLSPAWSLPLLNLSLLKIQQGEFEKAENIGRQLIELDSAFAPAYNNLGITYQGMGDAQQAEVMYRKAVDLQDDVPFFWYNLGGILLDNGSYKEAARWLEKYHETVPGDAGACYQLARLNWFLEKYQKVEKWYKLTLTADPDYHEMFRYLGTLYLTKLGQLPEAEAAYLRYLEYEPNDNAVYYNLACIASLDDRYEKSAEYLELAIQKGWDDYDQIQSDSDLAGLREAVVYRELINRLFPEKAEK